MDDFSPVDFVLPIQELRRETPLHAQAVKEAGEWLNRFWAYLKPALAQRAFTLLETEASLNEDSSRL